MGAGGRATAKRTRPLAGELADARLTVQPAEGAIPGIQPTTTRSTSEEQRQLHNLTNLPYQPWCPHCVAMKAREDSHMKSISKPTSSADSSMPVISFDFCYTRTTGSAEPPAVVLIAVDSWNKAVLAVPCKRIGGIWAEGAVIADDISLRATNDSRRVWRATNIVSPVVVYGIIYVSPNSILFEQL